MKTSELLGFKGVSFTPRLEASPRLFSVGLALFTVLGMAFLRLLLAPFLEDRLSYAFFYVAIVVSLWYCGWGSALLAMVLGFVAGNWFFVSPMGAFELSNISQVVETLIYFMVGGIIIGGGQSIRNCSLALLERQADLRKENKERQKAQAQLAEQVQEMEAIYQEAPLGLALFDRELRYLRINRAMAAINGVPMEDSIGRTKWEVLGDLAERIAPACRQVIESGHPLEQEIEGSTRTSPGRRGCFWIALYPLFDGNAQVRAVSCIVQDITERKETQNLNARLAAVVQSSSEAILSATPEGIVKTWNPAAAKMFGYTAAEIVGQPASLLTPPLLQEEFNAFLARVHQGESIKGQETVRMRKDGTLAVVVISLSPLLSEDGSILGITAVLRDITERKKAERVLRENETRLALAIEVAEVGFWEWELPTSKLYVSERCREMFAVPPGKNVPYYEYWVKSLHPEDRKRVTMALEEALRSQGEYAEDYRILWPDGSVHWISAKGRILSAQQERPCRMLGVLSDITARKKAETALQSAQEQLSRQNHELEEKVHERTARLREALTDLEQFSSSIAHDLRAPVRTMSQFASLVQLRSGDKLDEVSKDFLAQVIAGAKRTDKLIEDVLAYSRMARTELNLSPIDLSDTIRQVLQASPSFKPPHAEIDLEVSHVSVQGHATALAQSITNLLSNAIKFVPPGTRPHVRIWTEAVDDQIRLFIEDNGIGIEEADLNRIWGVFERVSEGAAYEGTGIGLSIVRRAVERMGGTVGVKSKPGRGSTFWLQLKSARPRAEQ